MKWMTFIRLTASSVCAWFQGSGFPWTATSLQTHARCDLGSPIVDRGASFSRWVSQKNSDRFSDSVVACVMHRSLRWCSVLLLRIPVKPAPVVRTDRGGEREPVAGAFAHDGE